MQTSLLIAASPLQLLNVLEAKNYFGIERASILILFESNSKNRLQIDYVLKKLNITEDITYVEVPLEVKESKVESFLFLLKLRKKLYKKIKYDKIVIGHFRSIYQFALANLNEGGDFIFVDDGSRTVDDVRFLQHNEHKSWKYRIKHFVYSLFSLEPYPCNKEFFKIFTYYANRFAADNKIKIYENRFESLKKIINEEKYILTEKVVFIGQSLVDSKLLKKPDFFKLLGQVNGYYQKRFGKGIEVEYFAHRNESDDVLKEINENFGWNIKINDLPLELHFIFNKELPREIGLFFTSAAETMSIIFEEKFKFKSFNIPSSYLLYRVKEIEELYKINTKSDKIEVVDDFMLKH